jgi:hypothetical protein
MFKADQSSLILVTRLALASAELTVEEAEAEIMAEVKFRLAKSKPALARRTN